MPSLPDDFRIELTLPGCISASACFRVFDLENTGFISTKSLCECLRRVLHECGYVVPDHVIQQIVVRTFLSVANSVAAGVFTGPSRNSTRPISILEFKVIFIRSPTLMDCMTLDTWRLLEKPTAPLSSRIGRVLIDRIQGRTVRAATAYRPRRESEPRSASLSVFT